MKSVKIPKTVKIGGKNFKVVSIANKAFAGTKVQKVVINSNFAHRFSLCTLKIQYWQLFSYLNSYAMLLEAVSSVKQVPCS